MKTYKDLVHLFLSTIFLLTSCADSNHVVSNRLIQKRKYTKGWFIKRSNTNNSELSNYSEKDSLKKSNPTPKKNFLNRSPNQNNTSTIKHATDADHPTLNPADENSEERSYNETIENPTSDYTLWEPSPMDTLPSSKSNVSKDQNRSTDSKNKTAGTVFIIVGTVIILLALIILQIVGGGVLFRSLAILFTLLFAGFMTCWMIRRSNGKPDTTIIRVIFGMFVVLSLILLFFGIVALLLALAAF